MSVSGAVSKYYSTGRSRWQCARLSAALPFLLILMVSLSLAAPYSFAAAKGKRYGAPLKFDAPPVDLDLPGEGADAPGEFTDSPVPSPAAPEGNRTGVETAPAVPPAAPGGASAPIRLFGTVEFRSPVKNLPKWERVRNSESKKPSFIPGGMDTQNKAVSDRWQRLREKLKNAPFMEKVKGVNTFFNQWPYKTDLDVWGVEDYWATPREFVQKSGDCEDYAISKYYALRDLGVPAEALRIAAVKDSIRNLGHAVTIVFHGGDAHVLDNLTNLMLSHKRLTQYKPQFSVNEQYLWRHIQPKSGPTR